MNIHKQDNKKMNARVMKIVCVVFALALLAALAINGIFAKYIIGSQTKGYISSPAFYFSSDVLKNADDRALYTLNPGADGTTGIKFELRNFADQLRISDKDISFSVNVSPSEDIAISTNGVLNNEGKGTLTANPSGGSIAKVAISGLKNGQTYTITATGSAGFFSSLTAQVVVKPEVKEIYKYLDVSDPNYVVLTVWTENIFGTVNVEFPDGLIPDSTDGVMSGVYNYSEDSYVSSDFDDSTSFTTPYSSRMYRFFKTSNQDYIADDFKVRLGSAVADKASPK